MLEAPGYMTFECTPPPFSDTSLECSGNLTNKTINFAYNQIMLVHLSKFCDPWLFLIKGHPTQRTSGTTL